MPKTKFIGTVNTGQGNGKFFIKLPWVTRQLKELNFTPYIGTLNLHLTPESTKQRKYLTPQNGILIKPENGYLPGYLYKAMISDTKCYVILPDVPNYPKNLLEIIAAENLRDLLNVKDGDKIVVIVTTLQN
ncbi:MAG: CTP-dependent riboflavin kinase [Nitrososphaerota archaeon]|nr:CTP-dependent riboflavin kinase [Nitrososphaerota archaeon]